MRLTITKKNKHKRRKKQIIVVAILGLNIVSISLGYLITKNIVAPYWNKNSNKIEETQVVEKSKPVEKSEKTEVVKEVKAKPVVVQDKQVILNSIEMYSIEIARFKSLDEANEFIEELNASERLGYVSQGKEYIVFSDLTLSKKEIDKREASVKEKYPQAIVRSVQTVRKELHIASSEEEIFNKMRDTIELLNSSFTEELNIWIEDIKNINYSSLKEKIDENNKKITDSTLTYGRKFKAEDIDSEELKMLYLNIDKNIEIRKNVSKEFKSENIEEIKKTYYNYVESLFNYINYYKM